VTDSPSTESRASPNELAAKVAFLLRRAFPERPEAVETHLSWVFLTRDRAYKLKKPVLRSFLDHRRVEARRRDCEAEVALNRPLAPGVYLGTVPLTADRSSGTLALGGDGRPVDWLVVMRRLPEASFLDHRLRTDPTTVTDGEVAAVIDHLAGFYRSTARRPLDATTHRRTLLAGLEEDRYRLLRHDHAVDHDAVADLIDRLGRAVADPRRLAGRAARLVDGHGDLRPDHVVLTPRPLVLDRITFDEGLRRIDPAADLALLAVECRLLGAAEVGRRITVGCLERIGDPPPPADRALYRSLRAVTRARLSVAHLDDSDHDADRWLDRADAYLAIAADDLLTVEDGGAGDSGVEVEQLTE